jgi:hypothetical protein
MSNDERAQHARHADRGQSVPRAPFLVRHAKFTFGRLGRLGARAQPHLTPRAWERSASAVDSTRGSGPGSRCGTSVSWVPRCGQLCGVGGRQGDGTCTHVWADVAITASIPLTQAVTQGRLRRPSHADSADCWADSRRGPHSCPSLCTLPQFFTPVSQDETTAHSSHRSSQLTGRVPALMSVGA